MNPHSPSERIQPLQSTGYCVHHANTLPLSEARAFVATVTKNAKAAALALASRERQCTPQTIPDPTTEVILPITPAERAALDYFAREHRFKGVDDSAELVGLFLKSALLLQDQLFDPMCRLMDYCRAEGLPFNEPTIQPMLLTKFRRNAKRNWRGK